MDLRTIPVSLSVLAGLLGIAIGWAIHVERDLSELKTLLTVKASAEDSGHSTQSRPAVAMNAPSSDTHQQTVQITGPLVAAPHASDNENKPVTNQQNAVKRRPSPECVERRHGCTSKREFCLFDIKQSRNDVFMSDPDSKIAQREREMRDDCNTEFERCAKAALLICE